MSRNDPGPALLVSVRSVAEARSALLGGATVIDIKEPARGPLGAADPSVWQAVRAEVPADVTVSVALGELRDLSPDRLPKLAPNIGFRKVGLSGSLSDWRQKWSTIRSLWPDPAGWIAVIYADWIEAAAPHPDEVIDAAEEARCAGVLIDTWTKGRPSPLDDSWVDRIDRIRSRVGLVALAGGLDLAAIGRLACLGPDLFAVRGAACFAGDRNQAIDQDRVEGLARLVRSQRVVTASRPVPTEMAAGRVRAQPPVLLDRGG